MAQLGDSQFDGSIVRVNERARANMAEERAESGAKDGRGEAQRAESGAEAARAFWNTSAAEGAQGSFVKATDDDFGAREVRLEDGKERVQDEEEVACTIQVRFAPGLGSDAAAILDQAPLSCRPSAVPAHAACVTGG